MDTDTHAIHIALATEADLQAIADLFNQYRRFYGQTPDLAGAVEFIRDRLTRQDSTILTAAIAGRIVGFTQLYPSFSSIAMKPIWILNDLYVAADYRRRGIAQALMGTARDHAQVAGAIRIVLSTQVSNLAAKSLYESLGYIRDSEFDDYVLSLS